MFVTCGVSFLIADLSYAMGLSPVIWMLAAFAGNLLVPFITANGSALMRVNVPPELQGRVFAARDTLQNLPYPLGLFLGGFLADKVFEPFMSAPSPVQNVLSHLVGTGRGSGMAVMMLLTGLGGFILSALNERNPVYKGLESTL